MSQYIMALDQGTTSSRCILFDHKGNVVSTAQKEYPCFYPQSGWVEQNPMDIWSTQISVAQEALYKIGATYKEIAAMGITNQRETTIVWDKRTGKPIHNAIVWQCRRTAPYCDSLKQQGLGKLFQEKTGLMIDAYFSATKIRWILENVPSAREEAEKGNLLFGTVDTWLIWNLTKGAVHATDYSNASRTMLFNIHTLSWDKEILAKLGIPEQMLPQVFPSSHIFGTTDASLFGGEIPISAAAGDQQSALFGQTCFEVGSAKNTYGTGCFMLMNTGQKPVLSKNGLLTTIAWGQGGTVTYALEGSIFVAGAAIQWLRDEMQLISSSAESEKAANQVPDTNGVYMVPAFVGLGAPYWDSYARGAIVGLNRNTNRNHIIRATLESLAYQTCDVLQAMEEDSGIALQSLRADGGACANNFLMQFQANIIGVPVDRPVCIETTALGAAYMAGLAIRYWKDLDVIKAHWNIDKTFYPLFTEAEQEEKRSGWKRAVQSVLVLPENSL
ncbi:MAG: glycerol kinase GlpK [Epulopiscium sp.]|nr:glycerol kinase GlpK [Candidatus Epulonipiscium sp.]